MINELELAGVGVLIFVHHDIAVLAPAGLQGFGMFPEKPQGQEDEVVEVYGIAGVEGALVAASHVFGESADRGVFEAAAAAAILELAEHGQHGSGIGLFSLGRDLAQDLFHRGELVAGVVDDEVLLVAQFLDVLSEDPHTERVECAQGGAFEERVFRCPGILTRFAYLGDHLVDPLEHFLGGLVGEGHRQDVSRGDALADHVSNPASQGACLACAGSGQDEDRTGVGDNGGSLLRIERSQIKHGGRRMRRSGAGSRGTPRQPVFPFGISA